MCLDNMFYNDVMQLHERPAGGAFSYGHRDWTIVNWTELSELRIRTMEERWFDRGIKKIVWFWSEQWGVPSVYGNIIISREWQVFKKLM